MAKRATAAAFSSILLDEASSEPLYRQLYSRLRTAILMRQLPPGTRLPSTRELANELNISRNTVMNAYDQLLAEGYLEGQVGSGTFVSLALPDDLLQVRASPRGARKLSPIGRGLSRRGQLLANTRTAVTPLGKARPLLPGRPAFDEFPISVWSSLVARHWDHVSTRMLDYGEAAGYKPLREAIAAYLSLSRAVQCAPDQVIVVSGTQQALDLAARVLLDPGDSVWMEEYSYLAAQAALVGAGAKLISIPVDDEGLNCLSKAPTAVPRLIYVTPSHQYPLGVTMSLPRRLALIDCAKRFTAWILEDDYDSEYRYVGRPLAALQGLDTEERVIYLGTFSKALFPSLRIGYMVVPQDLVAAFVGARAAVGWCSPIVDQAVLADFINEGHFARHIRRMRALYSERQRVLVETLDRECEGLLDARGDDAGIHLTAWLSDRLDEREVVRQAEQRGVKVQPLSSFAVDREKQTRKGLVLGYGAYDVDQIKEAAIKLGTAVRAAASPTVHPNKSKPMSNTNSRRVGV
jgi:GntR family transcriptional regulator/MocR family aminotransferase